MVDHDGMGIDLLVYKKEPIRVALVSDWLETMQYSPYEAAGVVGATIRKGEARRQIDCWWVHYYTQLALLQ